MLPQRQRSNVMPWAVTSLCLLSRGDLHSCLCLAKSRRSTGFSRCTGIAAQVPDAGLKEYWRLMEPHVAMNAHLEIGIALGLEAVQQQPEAVGQATAVDGACELQ